MEQLALGWVLLASTLFGTAATCSRRDVRGITKKVMDMAWDSFDDQYQDCSRKMEEKLETVNRTEFKNKVYKDTWKNASEHWQKQWGNSNRPQVLPQEQAVAVLAYTHRGDLSNQLNKATHKGGRSPEHYLESFPFKTLHFLLTEAVHTLQKTQSPKCNSVYRGTTDRFTAQLEETVRFGQFTSTSLDMKVARSFGNDTFFFVKTCYGVSIENFSFNPKQKEVLVPPYEVFKVTNVIHHTKGTDIHLDSHSTHSNYSCALLNGTSSPREPPHLWSLLLAAAALAAVGRL
ncbi:erythroblast NAD(P)(+)--arginine ADP-ribosyltransferase isoform X2 [Anas platyrhynchos]|uniref:erythroblast NAD(P)(+)--arginine ADP-ribosyltransferase isoform X2 n=1 Tax=Anas platyrhynchos TaxID=8839 RepID=UPI003AF2C776